ncbi:MAG TPA: glycosyltransferase [Steroidobacteraceae bacterium]|nr:glycosyltransferase [Steroidobacteraceae bacterium]HRX90665.1 glycosyltransferase [Steroidobacteraceae bacterium]
MHLVDATLFFSPTSGGVKRYLLAKRAWLAAHSNWQHTLLVPGEHTRLERGSISTITGGIVPGTFNYRLPLKPWAWSRALNELAPDITEVGDVFHPAWCARIAAHRRKTPLVAFYHSNFPQLAGRRLGRTIEWLLARYVRETYAGFDLVFAPSRYMCDYLASIGVRHTAMQPLGVDADVFSPERRVRDLRTALGLAQNTRLLAFAGRFAGEKNLPVLLDAFTRLGDGYHLLLIGGDQTGRVASNVTKIAYRRDSRELAEWLASCDALVHAGTRETFGLVVLEAMACGRPVVGTRAGAVPELVDESVGTLAAPHDSASLARSVADLYDRDIELLGAAARERVLRRFTWNQAMQLQMQAYAAVARGARVPSPAVEQIGLRA